MAAVLFYILALFPVVTGKAVVGDFQELKSNMLLVNLNTSEMRVLHQCRLTATDSGIHATIDRLRGTGAKLVEFDVSFPGYDMNPLMVDMANNFQGKIWNKALTKHGRTLLALPFNYRLLSLNMLTFGTYKLRVHLEDSPKGCFGNFSSEQKVIKMVDTVLSDFGRPGRSTGAAEGSACHQRINNKQGVAEFVYDCCERQEDGVTLLCSDDVSMKWITIMNVCISAFKIAVFLIGPSLLSAWTYGENTYIVRLKRPLVKNILAVGDGLMHSVLSKASVKAVNMEQFPLFSQTVKDITPNRITQVSFEDLHIQANERRLVNQKSVPVGLFRFMFDNLIWCGMRRWEPFYSCCKRSVLGTWGPRFLWFKLCRNTAYSGRFSWERIFNLLGGLLLMLIIPSPYYLRAAVYYIYEDSDIQARREATEKLGLTYPFDNSVVHNFAPDHPAMITLYVVYSLSFILVVILRGYFGKVFDLPVMASIKDMSNVKKRECFRLTLAHFILPFEKFGILGIVIGLMYWPIVLPLCFLVMVCYVVPMVYLIGRFFIHARPTCIKNRPYPTAPTSRQSLSRGALSFESCMLLENISPTKENDMEKSTSLCLVLTIGLLCSILIVTVFLLLAEVLGFFVEVFLFTLMGAIVNTSSAATYFMLAFWILVYSSSCFNNVYNEYMELNLKLFDGFKTELEDEISAVTNLRAEVQKNTAFKFFDQDELEQLRYEEAENERKIDYNIHLPVRYVCTEDRLEWIGGVLQWRINSLAMFVDSNDIPYIPERLFHEICNLDIPGSPGPIHLNMFDAFKQLGYMVVFLVFVLITVMSFGDELSMGNQMLVALAGGFLPFVVRFVLKPKQSEIDVTSLAFKAKLREIKLRFSEAWPVSDLPFRVDNTDTASLSDEDVVNRLMVSKNEEERNDLDTSSHWLSSRIDTILSGFDDMPFHYASPLPSSVIRVSGSYANSAGTSFDCDEESLKELIAVDLKNNSVHVDYRLGQANVALEDKTVDAAYRSAYPRTPSHAETPL